MLGLIISVIFSASMSSTSSELNALSSTTAIDIYKRLINPAATEKHMLNFSRISTFAWGIYAIIFACYANRLGSLIEAVNVIGSLVYGTILGIFLTGFYVKRVGAGAVLLAGLIVQTAILLFFFFTDIPFLWYNVFGGLAVPLIAFLIQLFFQSSQNK
jgi:Na+/proline symporter